MSRELQMYGIVFMNAMRYIVDNIDNDEAIKEKIISIAGSHKKWGVHKTHIKVSSSFSMTNARWREENNI